MNPKIIPCLLALLLILVVPQVYAQYDGSAIQKSVRVMMDDEGNVEVVHHIRESSHKVLLRFIDGTVSDLEFIDRFGGRESVDVEKDAKHIIFLPNEGEMFVRYDLGDALVLKGNIWTLNFRYLQTTTFVFPDQVKLLFANERPVFLESKNAFRCHGCQLILEYTIDEPRKSVYATWEDRTFPVEIMTFADIENFGFSQPGRQLHFQVNDKDQFVTVVIPIELLGGPYTVSLNDEKILFHEYINNGTHVWINTKPDAAGEVVIMGTSVIPEFPIMAPLAIGFLILLVVPLLRKTSLH